MAQASTQVQAAVRPVEVAREARPERHVSWWHLVVYLLLQIDVGGADLSADHLSTYLDHEQLCDYPGRSEIPALDPQCVHLRRRCYCAQLAFLIDGRLCPLAPELSGQECHLRGDPGGDDDPLSRDAHS